MHDCHTYLGLEDTNGSGVLLDGLFVLAIEPVGQAQLVVGLCKQAVVGWQVLLLYLQGAG